MEKMFEKITRTKLRFNAGSGVLAAEDLWDLSLQQLNTLAKKLNRAIKETQEEDFLKVKNAEDNRNELRFKVVIYVLTTKKEESEDRLLAKDNRAKLEKLKEALDKKQDDIRDNMTEEEIQKAIAELI